MKTKPAGPTCDHVLERAGATRLFCGKPASFWLGEWGWNLCGIRMYWLNRHAIVIEGTNP